MLRPLSQNFTSILKNRHVLNSLYIKHFHRSSCLLEDGENVRNALFCPMQNEKAKRTRKVSVIGGSGFTGSTMAYTLLIENYCDEIVMFDIPASAKKLCGQVLDCAHSDGLYTNPKIIVCTDYQNTKDSDLVIFNAGVGLSKGKTRLDLLQDNVNIFAKIVPPIAKLSPQSVFLVVSNPADVMAYAAWKYSGFDKNRVLSTGTELDSARFRYHISKRIGINPISVKGWIVGEHGDSSVAAWSTVNVAGTKLRDIDPCIGTENDENDWNELHKQVIKDGPMIHFMKGCTQYGIARTADIIAKSVLSNSRLIHSVSTPLNGLYGIETDVFISFPCVIGNRGVSEIVQLCLDDNEVELLNKSACILQKTVAKVKFP